MSALDKRDPPYSPSTIVSLASFSEKAPKHAAKLEWKDGFGLEPIVRVDVS